MIYLDYAATTPLDPFVEEAMRPFGQQIYGNPSSLHAAGRQARAAIDDARDIVADLLGARSAEIIFTSGGTEADNLAIKGVARAMRSRGDHIITTAIEHHAVLESCQALEREGFRITYLTPDAVGIVHARQVEEAITPATVLVSVMYANNEVGTIQPIAEIGRICRERSIPFHTDAVQAAGELDLCVDHLYADLLTLSAHKFYGPKGVGALYIRTGVRLQPIIQGGGQELERRAGTENTAGIVGLAAALKRAHDPAEIARLRALCARLYEGVTAIPDSRVHGSMTYRLSNNLNAGFTGVAGETLLLALDLAGIAVSTGSACAAGAVEPSHVLRALGLSRLHAQEAIRMTLGRETTAEEIERIITVLQEQIPRLRHRGAASPPSSLPTEGCPS